MNPDLFIYDKMPRKANYGTNIKSTTTIYIHESLLKHPEWLTYNKGYLLRYFGVRDFLLEMAFITNLAYTYRQSGEEVYQISPFYVKSLYTAMDWRSSLTETKQNQRLSFVLRTSRMMKDYLVVEEKGRIGHNVETRRREFFYSKYRVTDKLKELASKLNEGTFWEVEIEEISQKADAREKLPCMKDDKLYLVYDDHGNEKEFHSLKDARVWTKLHEGTTPELVQTPNRLVRMNVVKKYTYHEIDNLNTSCKIQKKNEKRQVSVTNTVSVNREEIKKILSNPQSGSKYSYYIMGELFRMYDVTTDEDNVVELKYFQSKQGRHYTMGSAAQLFPKELRERIFSDYVAVDMECSIFSLYKNLAKKYGYKKKTPQIDELIRDRRTYRERFVSPLLSYDGVKTILTAIAYGAVVDIYNMYMDINHSYNCYRKSSLLYCGYDKNSVLHMCNSDEIIALTKELRSMGRFIISKCTDKERNCIVNLCGNSLSLTKKKNFGVKMAHIYQSYEAAILMELRKVKINNQSLDTIPQGIGLYLHDGMYVRKDLAKKYDLCQLFSQRIKEVFDFDIKYELEI